MLFEGDNLEHLQNLQITHKGLADLVYIDPPFFTNVDYRLGATVSSPKNSPLAYSDKWGSLEEFLNFLKIRLILIKELMSDKASIYLHTDYKVGHYVKIVMDEVFGIENFKNDISRIKCNPKNFSRKAFGNIKDMILFYTKTKNYIWNDIKLIPDEKSYKKRDPSGRFYKTVPVHAPGESEGSTGDLWRNLKPPKGRHWRVEPKELELLDSQGKIEWSKTGNPRKMLYLDESLGQKIQDIWTFKDSQNIDYPTQKNYDMIELIVKNSSDVGSVVLDCFCGSGTTLLAAKNLGRKWIGVDKSSEAIKICKDRLGL